jgi:deoxyuridine 5'-triphosphate nucleotidohydrolase
MKRETLKYIKIRNVKDPERGTSKSAGIDFFIPKFTDNFLQDLRKKNLSNNIIITERNGIAIPMHKSVLIPSGIKVNIPKNYTLIAFNKSGISTKKDLDCLACVIDEDYQGEIHISLKNTNQHTVFLNENDKIIQFLLLPINYCELQQSNSIEELYQDKYSERLSGGFGSTNK